MLLDVEFTEADEEMPVDFAETIRTNGQGAVNSVNGKTGDVTLDAEDVGALPEDTPIPSKTSDLQNDSGFLTQHQSLAAYRTAEAQDVIDSAHDNDIAGINAKIPAAASSVNKLMDAAAVNAAIASAVAGITGFSYEIVQALPASGEAGVIYLLSNSGSSPNIYDEYIWIGTGFEKIGTTEMDLSQYRTAAAQDVIDAGKLSTEGNGSNVTVAFTAASTRTNLTTGEKLSVLFGKIAKWFSDLGSAAFRGATSSVTQGSTDLVESGAVYTGLAGKYSKPAGGIPDNDIASASTWNAKGTYSKPNAGIPKSDLASDVQTSLGKADTAIQNHQDISGKADKVQSATSGNFAALNANGNLVDSGHKPSDFLTQHQSLAAYRTSAAQDAIDANLMALGLTGASVGDLVRINTVDANGKPTSWAKITRDEITKMSAKADELAIVINGNTSSLGADAGQYVILRNSTISGKADGLYTAAVAIPANTAIDATYLSGPISGGGLNELTKKTSGVPQIASATERSYSWYETIGPIVFASFNFKKQTGVYQTGTVFLTGLPLPKEVVHVCVTGGEGLSHNFDIDTNGELIIDGASIEQAVWYGGMVSYIMQ